MNKRFFSPGRTMAIAANTLLELVRLKVFYFLLIFALFVIGSSAFMVKFSFQEQFQVLKDVGFGAMSIFSWLLSVLAAAMLLPKDIEDRTLYTILAKPVSRFEYFTGKWMGVLLLLGISIALMSVMFGAALYIRQQTVIGEAVAQMSGGVMGHEHSHADAATPEVIRSIKASTFTPSLLYGVVAVYLRAAVFATLTLFISTYASSTIFTVIISTMVYFIGHIQSVAREYWLSGEGTWISRGFLSAVALLFPDLQVFNLTDDIVAGNVVAAATFLKMLALGGGYLAVYFALAQWVFSAKEL